MVWHNPSIGSKGGWLVNNFFVDLDNTPAVGLYPIKGIHITWICPYNSMKYVIFPLFCVWMYVLFMAVLVHHKIVELNTAMLIGLFYETENEPGSASDYKLLCDQVAFCSLINLTLGVLLLRFPEKMASPTVVNATMILVYVLVLPATVSLIFGTYIMNYLKGDSDANNLLYSGIFDLANFVGFFKRFLVQFIRYVLIFIKIALFDFFMKQTFEKARASALMDKELFVDTWFIVYATNDVFYYIREAIHCSVELTNMFIIYYAQLGAFVIVLFWLLKALYSNAWPIVKYRWFTKK